MRRLISLASMLLISAILAVPAWAGWGITNLDPVGSAWSHSYAASLSQQVGYTRLDDYYDGDHASLWSSTAESWVDLNPVWATKSCAYGVFGEQQVGYAVATDGANHAGFWRGTAESWTDLNPVGASSIAYATSGDRQVGFAYLGSYAPHASLWSGTAESWVDLNPEGNDFGSIAYGVSVGRQVGYVMVRDTDDELRVHASLWEGTAESWVDLNPLGAIESIAYGVYAGQQVGRVNGSASLWSGTAESWVNLQPVDAGWSEAFATHGGWQVGRATVDYAHASLWNGTAESWVDLHGLLSSGVYSSSEARGIYTSDGHIWVSGGAYNDLTGHTEAIIWHYTPDVPEPSSLVGLAAGSVSLLLCFRRRLCKVKSPA